MSLGYLADRNEVAESPCTITSNVDWAETAPLEALRTTPLIDASVSLALGTEADPVWLRFEWAHPVDMTYAGLHDTNLWQSSGFRMEAYADTEEALLVATTTTADGRDRNVVPPLTDPAALRAGAPNQMRGDLDPRDFLLLPTNLHAVVPVCRVKVMRWLLWGGAYQPDGSEADGYRIGLAWGGDGLLFDRHLGSSGEGVRSGDERIETPGGGVWVEPGITRRVALIDRTVTDRALRDALYKMALRSTKKKPLVWLPNTGDAAACFLYGGLYRRSDDHQHKYVAPRYSAGSLELEEWKE